MRMFRKALSSISLVLIFITVSFGQATVFADSSTSTFTPIHKYTFDSDSGTVVTDSVTSNGINGTATGTTIISGSNGNARHFNGTSDYISFNSKVIPKGKKSIRFKIRTISNQTEHIFSNTTTITDYGMTSGITSDGKIAFDCKQGTSSLLFIIISTRSVNNGDWHDVLLTWDGTTQTNAVKLYIDNILDTVSTATSTETNDPSYNLCVGRLTPDYPQYRFSGDLDEFEVYNSEVILAPTNLAAAVGNTDIRLNWNTVPGANSYKVYRSTTQGGPYGDPIATTSSTSYIDATAQKGTKYYYVIKAVNADGESAYSNEASATLPNRAILTITMINGAEKEYDLTTTEIDNFITWYDNRANGTGPAYFKISKPYNIGPFKIRFNYVIFDKILSFDVDEY
ncbi:MAG: LamG domain-containing protein [Clostridia bacterium]|nr:LamG domain-containing protein [Clostridia bacterium]